MNNNDNIEQNKENANIETKRLILYFDFLSYLWDELVRNGKQYNLKNLKEINEYYYKTLYILKEKESTSILKDADNLIKWLDENNDQLPDNIQQKFNEWLLTERL